MSDNKEDVRISILGLRDTKYIYKDPDVYFPEFRDEEVKNEMEIRMRYSWNLDEDRFGVFTDFLIHVLKGENKATVLEYECVTDFKVTDLKTHLTKKEDGAFQIERTLEESLARMSIAHGRGMLFQKTSLTKFRGIVYPLINIKDILLSNFPDAFRVEEKK